MQLKTLLLTLSLSLYGINIPAFADFNDGYDAYQKGDYKTAVSEWKSLADQGNAQAQFNLGVMYDNGDGVLKDDKQAVEFFRKAAEQGDAKAQLKLGFRYADGRGVLKDPKQAVKWYQKAADQDHSLAQNYLGWVYATGKGVLKDMTKAKFWIKKSYEGGDAKTRRIAKNNWDKFELWKY